MQKAFTSEAKLLYLCSPNNPTSNQLKPREIEALIEEFPGIVMVDEAYAEYADYSVVPLIKKYRNLVVLRTFSKAFSLAGLRLGYAVADPALAKLWTGLLHHTWLTWFRLRMGTKMLENIEMVRESVAALKKERGKLVEALNKIRGVEAFDSKTNFVSVQHAKALREKFTRRRCGRVWSSRSWANCSSTRIAFEPRSDCPT